MFPSLRVRLVVLALSLFGSSVDAQSVLFPAPLHLTRTIHDPLTEITQTIDEYYLGNRVVSVSNDRVTIADYEKGELISIFRKAKTHSFARFDQIARHAASPGAAGGRWSTRRSPRSGTDGRERFELSAEGEAVSVELIVDRSVALSKEAVEVILGLAYPNVRQPRGAALAAATAVEAGSRIRSQAADASTHGLPVEQTIHVREGSEEISFRNVITRIGTETVPAELVAIPPGSRLVESETTRRLEAESIGERLPRR